MVMATALASTTPRSVGAVASASSSEPIVVTISQPHGLRDRDEVKIAGVEGNSAANGTFFVKVKSTSVFSLYSDKKLKKPVAATGDYQFGGAAFRPFLEDYGIVVGINRYSEFSTLHGAEADAGRFAEWLRSPLGGMVAQDNVQVILSSDYEDPDPSDTSTWKPAETDLKTAF